jgi:hypothetical protein
MSEVAETMNLIGGFGLVMGAVGIGIAAVGIAIAVLTRGWIRDRRRHLGSPPPK